MSFALFLIPATLLRRWLPSLLAGRDSVGNATVVVAGLAVLAVSLLVRLSFQTDTRSLLSRLS